MSVTPELLALYDLPPCDFQTAAGRERPCCRYAWLLVSNPTSQGQKYAEEVLTNVPLGYARTACIPRRFGPVCREAMEE